MTIAPYDSLQRKPEKPAINHTLTALRHNPIFSIAGALSDGTVNLANPPSDKVRYAIVALSALTAWV
jgi:hypothetical protein